MGYRRKFLMGLAADAGDRSEHCAYGHVSRILKIVSSLAFVLVAVSVLSACGQRVASSAARNWSDYSWEELSSISEEIETAASDAEGLEIARRYGLANQARELEGATKAITLADGTQSSVRIIGFRHDEKASGGKAGITFEFTDIPATRRMGPERENSSGWEQSEMRSWLNEDFYELLPDDLKPLIVDVRKQTNNTGRITTEDVTVVTQTVDRVWLLSMSEVYGELSTQAKRKPHHPAVYDQEGSQYQFYANQSVTTETCSPVAKNGSYSYWWLRSPRTIDDGEYHVVETDGSWSVGEADNPRGVSPCFCI